MHDARYYSAFEAAWRLLKFPIVEHEPAVELMPVHLENQHTVYYKKGEHLQAHAAGKKQVNYAYGAVRCEQCTPTKFILEHAHCDFARSMAASPSAVTILSN